MRRRRAVVLLPAVLLLATACTEAVPGVASPGGPASSTSAPPPSDGPAPPPEPAPAPAPAPTDEQLPQDGSFPADTADDSGAAQPGAADDPPGSMRIDGLRLSTRDGYTRLVVDLSGSGVPEWSVGYSEPSGPGGGPVDIAGDAFLRVQVRTQAAPGGQSTSRVRTSPGPVVEARTTGFFEGYEEVLIGIDGGEQPFRAFALTDPGRIVVDVRYG
ncbi:AMIN-like domain-containing (lipo)protein [Blastococcus tunisiensis]|uniref:AMIN-like domain-containing protein n=1 Tax=Blastococcus tunisiensis TaxID=1798228 RepID=A0A1I1W6J0_9ACTN|nr:hypothetical protein [Blastococcus sp. DSM 46838]SFD90629.1 hypothetical protein SAMN05216574_101256 [Blastococcus sp. DSM 46838]